MAKHWRSFLESKTLSVGDLADASPTASNVVRITRVESGRVQYSDGPTTRMMISLQGYPRPWSCGPRILTQIAELLGTVDPHVNWIGKTIAIYATTDRFGKDTVDAIRVRKTLPAATARAFGDADTGAAPFDVAACVAELGACASSADLEALAEALRPVVPKEHRAAVKAAIDAKRASFAPTMEPTP